MCASCGCGKLNENHGDERHLTMNDLQQAAEAADIDVQEVAQNLSQAAQQGQQQQAGQRQQARAGQRTDGAE